MTDDPQDPSDPEPSTARVLPFPAASPFVDVIKQLVAKGQADYDRGWRRLALRADEYKRVGGDGVTNDAALFAALVDELLAARLKNEELRRDLYSLEERVDKLEASARRADAAAADEAPTDALPAEEQERRDAARLAQQRTTGGLYRRFTVPIQLWGDTQGIRVNPNGQLARIDRRGKFWDLDDSTDAADYRDIVRALVLEFGKEEP